MARIRFALRSLAKAPLLSLVVILSLGLGIGANTAIFSLLHQVILRSLPVEKPEELVLLTSPGEFKGGSTSVDNSGGADYIFNYRTFRELEKRPQGVTGVAGFRYLFANLALGRQTLPGSVMVVSGGYFPLLGIGPLVGRVIAPEDDLGGGHAVAVLGYGYWHDRLGARPAVLGQSIRINGHVFTIVGVAPRRFTSTTLGFEPDTYVPISFEPMLGAFWGGTEKLDHYWVYLLARLKPGITRPQAAAALNGVYGALVEEQARTIHDSDDNRSRRFRQSRLSLEDGRQGHSSFRDDTRTPLFILMAATAMVLLIAMANAANLLLARSAQHRRELAIRAAMGAGRGDLMGMLLTEAMLLALGGGAAGILLGSATLRFLVAQLSDEDMPAYFLTSQLDWPVLLFSLGISLATGLLFGLYPAWDASRISLAGTLREESGQASSTRGTARVRKLLVCAQVMVSAVLLIPTGLLLKSLVNLMHVDLGMQTEHVIGFAISPERNGYTQAQSRALFERVETGLAAIPGVRGAGASLVPLITGSNWKTDVMVEGAPPDPHADNRASIDEVGPGFFGTLGIPLLAGRDFTERDHAAAPKVAIVNQQFASHILAGRSALGRKFAFAGAKKPDIEIVGVVKDSRYAGVKQEPPRLFYTPWRQDRDFSLGSLNFYVRSALPADRMIPQIRHLLASLDPDLPPESLRPLEDTIRRNIHSDRLVLDLAAAFAILATALAMLGLYGVMAHSVARRTREIGVRMALGAEPRGIRGMVMREMLWILGIGLATGVPAALALARFTESQLYGVKAYDAVVVAGAMLALALTAVVAGYLPARRASRVNPLDALRYE
jgi:predicted permease